MKIATLDVHALDSDGQGVAQTPRGQARIAGTVPGDRVVARFAHKSPHTGTVWFDAMSLEEPGTMRQPFPCPRAAPFDGECAGCPLIHVPEDVEIGIKRAEATALLGALLPSAALAFHRAPTRQGYRSRAHFVVHGRGHALRLGARIPRSAEVADVRGCAVLATPLRDVHRALQSRLATEAGDAAIRGLRYVTLRAGTDGCVLVELIARSKAPSEERVRWAAIAESSHPAVAGVFQSDNDSESGTIHAAPATHVTGASTTFDRLGDLRFGYTTDTFAQLNPSVARSMVDRAADWLAPHTPTRIWDLYSGVGVLGLSLARALDCEVYGFEVNPASVALASENAARNGLRAHFEVSNLAEAPTVPAPDTICVNPPRKGLAPPTRSWLSGIHTPLLYMSCSAKTLARDLRYLVEHGWSIERVEAWNMMPNTRHYELLALVSPPS